MRKFILLIFLLGAMLPAAAQMTQTPNYHLNLPPHGYQPYDVPINANFSTLDNLLKQGLINTYAADPAPCTGQIWYNSTAQLYKICVGGVPTNISAAGNIGTSNLPPIFTSTFSSGTLNFSLTAAQPNTVLANFSNSSAVPGYQVLAPCGDSTHALAYVSGTGFTCQTISGGTVTGVTLSDLSPLFTVSVTNPTTAPSFTFLLSNAAPNTLFGNFTSSSLPPSFNAMSPCGDTSHALSWAAGSGFGCQALSGGTVTTFSSGGLTPLFTSTVVNPGTAPALSFTLSNASANSLFGNFTGSSAAPTYNVLTPCGDSTHALSWVSGTGFGCQAISAGTVSTFSAGTLAPLFTTSVTNPGTTPALSFALSSAAANTIFGNFTGAGASPIYNAISPCGDAQHALSWVAGSGFSCQLISVLPVASAIGQIPVSTGAGSTYAAQAKEIIDVRDQGVDCTGAADSGSALNTLFANITGKQVDFPFGCQMKTTVQVVIQGQAGFVLHGNGSRSATGGFVGPVLYGCNAAASGAVLYINRSGYGRIEGLSITAKGPSGCSTSTFTQSVQVDSTGNPGVTTHDIIFDNMGLTTSANGGAITNYKGISFTDGGKGNGEMMRIRNSWIHCQNSPGSMGVDVNNNTSDANLVEDNAISSCFKGVALEQGNTRVVGNLISNSGNFSVFGSGGGAIWLGTCSSGPIDIFYNDEDSGGQFINTENDTANGCTAGVNVIGNNIGISDYDTANVYPVNLGTVNGTYAVKWNQAHLDQVPAGTIVGTKAQGTFGPLGTITLEGNQLQNSNGTVFGWCCQYPGFQQGQQEVGSATGVHSTTPFITSGFLNTIIYSGANKLGGFSSPTIYRSNSNNNTDDWFFQNVSSGSTSSTFAITHGTGAASGGVFLAFDGAIGGLNMVQLVAPGGVAVTPTGGTAATSYSYAVVATSSSGGVPSTVASTATGVASLSTSQYNQIFWNPVPGASGYDIYRTAGGATQGLIWHVPAAGTNNNYSLAVTAAQYPSTQMCCNNVNSYLFNDTGLTGNSAALPTANTTGRLIVPGLVQGQPNTSNGTNVVTTSARLYADQFLPGNLDYCAKVNAAILAAPASGGVVDARGFTSPQACLTNIYHGANKAVRVMLMSGNIVTSVPQYTPQVANKLEGVTMGNSTSAQGTTISACGPTTAGWNGSNACVVNGVTVPQFPNATTTMTFHNVNHGIYPPGTYACIICAGGQGASEQAGWNSDAFGVEVDHMRLDGGGNTNIFGFYSANVEERSNTDELTCGNLGGSSTSANVGCIVYDRTEAASVQSGPTHFKIGTVHANFNNTANSTNSWGVVVALQNAICVPTGGGGTGGTCIVDKVTGGIPHIIIGYPGSGYSSNPTFTVYGAGTTFGTQVQDCTVVGGITATAGALVSVNTQCTQSDYSNGLLAVGPEGFYGTIQGASPNHITGGMYLGGVGNFTINYLHCERMNTVTVGGATTAGNGGCLQLGNGSDVTSGGLITTVDSTSTFSDTAPPGDLIRINAGNDCQTMIQSVMFTSKTGTQNMIHDSCNIKGTAGSDIIYTTAQAQNVTGSQFVIPEYSAGRVRILYDQLQFTDGMGALSHILGPTDQPLALASKNGQNITINPNGTGKVSSTSSMEATSVVADKGTACTNGELVLSAGWGNTATVTTVVGAGQTCEWTLTSSGTGQAANPTVTDTLTNALPSATVICSMQMVGGTGANTLIDQTTVSATAPVFTFGGTPVAASTYKVVRRCGP